MISMNGGYDGFTGEHWMEVTAVHWRKRNGRPGKAIPDHIHDKALSYDPGLCQAMEYAYDHMIDEEG